MDKLLFFVPDQASSVASSVDLFFFFMVAVSGFFSVLIATLILFFAIRYREGGPAAEKLRTAPQPETPHGHGRGAILLEIVWTVIPFVLAMVHVRLGHEALLHALSATGRRHADLCRRQAMDVEVPASRGVREINELHVPVGQNVRLTMHSEDVIHSFFVPAFRVKQDVVPGRYTQTWFHATRTGKFHLFCAEYCGTQHSGMIGSVTVMEPSDYEAWLAGGGTAAPGQTLAQIGRAALQRARLQHLPLAEWRGPRAVSRRLARLEREARGRRHGRRRRERTFANRSSIRRRKSSPATAAHADVSGPVERRAGHRAPRLRPIARPEAGRRRVAAAAGSEGNEAMKSSHALAEGPGPALQELNYLNADYGIRSWLLTMDHKRIAILYLVVDHDHVLDRRRLRGGDPHRAADARRATSCRPTPTTSSSRCTASSWSSSS